MWNKIEKTILYILLSILLIIPFIYYCYQYSITMKELPYLTWIDQFGIAKKYFDGNLNFASLFTRYGEHGLFGYNLLYLINVKYFSLTTKFDVILNDVFVFLSFFICAILFVKSEKRNIKKMIIPLFCMSLFSFSIIQGSSGAMETQVRIGMSLSPIYAAILSYIYNKEDRMNWKNILLIVVISIIYINIFGTLYSFAIIPFMFIAIIYAFISRNKHKFNYIFPFIVIILCCLLYMYEYKVFLFDKSNPGQTGGVFEGVILLFKNIGETFLSWFSYNAGGVFGFDFDLVEMKNTFLGVGIFISFLILVSIFLFFYKKINKKSWVPFLLIGYSIFVFVLTRIGRINSWQYYCAEWYIVHTKYQMVGIIWIISSYLFDKKKFSYVFSTLNFAVNFVLLLFLLVGNKIISDRLPHVAMYYEGKQTYLFYPSNEMPVDENGYTPLLHNLNKTNEMISYLKKYNLSIYKYNSIGDTIDTAITSGIYTKEETGSRWISTYSNYILKPNGNTFNMIMYTPELGQNVKVYIDDDLIIDNTCTSNYNHFSIPTEKLPSVVKIKIVIDKEIENKNGDIRNLGVILIDLFFE